MRDLGIICTLLLLGLSVAYELGVVPMPATLFQRAQGILRHFLRDSLYRNSMYLLMNMGITAVSGFVFWIVCAHLYSQRDVGYASALFGGLALTTALANLGVNRTIVRFLAASKTQSRDVVTKLAIVGIGSMAAGGLMSVFLTHFGLQHVGRAIVVVFMGAALFSSLKIVFDNIFVALRSSSDTLIENTVFNIAKLIVPVLAISMGFIGIFLAQFTAAILGVIASVVLLATRHNFDLRKKPSRKSMNGKWQFAMGSYSSDLIGGLPTSILPIIVVAKLGPTAGALWYTVMLIINFLLTINSSVNQAMFAELSNAKNGQVFGIIRKSGMIMSALMIPIVAIVCLGAPLILKSFHSSYTVASPVLRMTAVFALLGILNYLSGSILALYKKVFYLTMVNIVNALVVILYCLVFAHNLQGIAIGWMLGEVANIILFAAGAWYLVIAKRKMYGHKELSYNGS